jgi:hypothetical protein
MLKGEIFSRYECVECVNQQSLMERIIKDTQKILINGIFEEFNRTRDVINSQSMLKITIIYILTHFK